MNEINYDVLKKRGFLKQRQEGLFILRTRSSSGNYSEDQILALAEISRKYGKGILHATTRQAIEIPFVRFEDIDDVEKKIEAAGINTGTSGPRVRATTCCPGNNWCKRGLVNTFGLFERIEKELDIRCGMDLPHKFKIVISGCPNRCTRAEASEIGIHGQIDTSGQNRRIGYCVYIGGCGGRTPHLGFKLNKTFAEDEVLSLIERIIKFYKEHAKPRQRLALLIKEIGKVEFAKKIGIEGLLT